MSRYPLQADLADAEDRRRIRDDHDSTLFVEAAAGTGKTTALVGRIVAMLVAGRLRLDRLVAVTFTDKAAGEMKLRLRAEIERARVDLRESDDDPGTRRRIGSRLDGALGQLEVARMGTIHAFCADLLHERPVEAGVDPLFTVLPEDAAGRLLEDAFSGWFESVLEDPPEGVRRILRRRPRWSGLPSPREQLLEAVRRLIAHRDFDGSWTREPFDRDGELDRVVSRLGELADLAGRAADPGDYLARHLHILRRFVDERRRREETGPRDHDGLEADLRDLVHDRYTRWNWKGYKREFGPGLPRAEVIALRDRVHGELIEFLEAADADIAARLRDELRPAVAAYDALKRASGAVDFLDLLIRARDLVRDDAVVRRHLQERFTHFFVDEFQDTDPLQAEILLLLAANDPGETEYRNVVPVPGKLFLVGDPKQSIYRFRRADVGLYEAIKSSLGERGAEVVHLRTSFRSLPAIQHAVNGAFAAAMEGGEASTQAAYVDLQPWRPDPGDRPAVVALPVPRPYAHYGKITNRAVDESLPAAAAATVDWLVRDSGWTVVEPGKPEEDRVPIRPRHVCLLFRRLRSYGADVTRSYVEALEERGIPHVLVGGRSFHDRDEVRALRNALAAIEWPDDELRVYAALRSPLFGLVDGALLAFRDQARRLHPLRIPDDPGPPDAEGVADALALLGTLHRSRNRRPIADTVSRLLEAVRAHAGIALQRDGEQALANCLRLVDQARRFERGGAPSFRAFVERLDEDAETGETQDTPLVEEGTEGVRIMTVHKAKGLEFPVVILADPTCPRSRRTPGRHIDADRGVWAESLCGCVPWDLLRARETELRLDDEEGVRLAYVAATRARDLLVVPAVGDEPVPGWFDVLHPAVYPAPRDRRVAAEAPGCPSFGPETVLDRPSGADAGPLESVAPGSHRPAAGEHAVVWWDPAALGLEVPAPEEHPEFELLRGDRDAARAAAGIEAHRTWSETRAATLEAAGRPTIRSEAVTRLAGEGAGPVAVEIRRVDGDREGRPGGRRFGSLVHAVLAEVDLAAGRETIALVAIARGRWMGASSREVAAAAVVVEAALADDLLREAHASNAVRREAAVQHVLTDGRVAEGVIDLAFRRPSEAGGFEWVVIDFKTDRELGPRQDTYLRQAELYARGIAAATGEPARGILLVI